MTEIALQKVAADHLWNPLDTGTVVLPAIWTRNEEKQWEAQA